LVAVITNCRPPTTGRLLMLEEFPIDIIRRSDVVDDDVGVVLADEGVEIHRAVPVFIHISSLCFASSIGRI
jgi:hypothetical protein